jgi:hypothetical protein
MEWGRKSSWLNKYQSHQAEQLSQFIHFLQLAWIRKKGNFLSIHVIFLNVHTQQDNSQREAAKKIPSKLLVHRPNTRCCTLQQINPLHSSLQQEAASIGFVQCTESSRCKFYITMRFCTYVVFRIKKTEIVDIVVVYNTGSRGWVGVRGGFGK